MSKKIASEQIAQKIKQVETLISEIEVLANDHDLSIYFPMMNKTFYPKNDDVWGTPEEIEEYGRNEDIEYARNNDPSKGAWLSSSDMC